MSLSPSFRPKLPDLLLHEENALFVSIAFECIFYGISFILYILTARNLLRPPTRNRAIALRTSWRSLPWKMLLFLSIQQISLLAAIIGNIQFAVLAFVFNREIQGGPVAFEILHANVPPGYTSLAAFSVCNWFQDILLLYRFLVIYNRFYTLFILPCLIFLTSLVFSLLLLIQLSPHPGLLNVGNNLPVSTIYFSLSVGLNVLLTTLIVSRLLYFRHLSRKTGGGAKLADQYVSISAMIVESAALSSIIGIALIATLHTNVAASIPIESLYGVMTVLSPVLIAYRVSVGQAWTRDMTMQSSIKFAPRSSGAGAGAGGAMMSAATSGAGASRTAVFERSSADDVDLDVMDVVEVDQIMLKSRSGTVSTIGSRTEEEMKPDMDAVV